MCNALRYNILPIILYKKQEMKNQMQNAKMIIFFLIVSVHNIQIYDTNQTYCSSIIYFVIASFMHLRTVNRIVIYSVY